MRITSINYLREKGFVKAVVCVSLPAFSVRLRLNGEIYKDAFNDEEPFDVKTHVFYIPEQKLKAATDAELIFRRFRRGRLDYTKKLRLGLESFADENELIAEYDHALKVSAEEKEELYPGVTFTKYTCADAENAPVIVSVISADMRSSSLYIGTPNDAYECRKVKATIPDMITAAEKNGVNVIAAVNADFFDMFGDCHPSGLCVKNGKLVANENSTRPFIGIKKDGNAVITDIRESPSVLSELVHAAAGLQMVVRDGKLFDWAPLEPFSFVRHPRTAAGLTKDGKVLLLEADGRIPAHSNGMSLVDLGKFMIALGADRAINLDGGGSSAVYTKKDGEHELRTVPADLFFPNDKLIRKDFNAVFVTEKTNR